MTLDFSDPAALAGQSLGVSDWVTIDQQKIDTHADITGDRDWLHNDVARAKDGPFGGTIAQGFLTLGHLTQLAENAGMIPANVDYALNYGFNRVRFLQPVPAGARIRDHVTIKDVREKDPGRYVLTTEHRVEIEGVETPALVAEWLGLFAVKAGR
jgi:acyl dehydratase